MGFEAQPLQFTVIKMKISIAVEVNGKTEGLEIEIDKTKLKKEHAEDPNMTAIGEAIKTTVSKVTEHLVKQIVIVKNEDEIEVELNDGL